MKVAFVSPMGLGRDGVGSYSRALAARLGMLCALEPIALDKEVHGRSHFRRMADAVNRCDLLHLEHAHPLFKVPLYPFREGHLDFLRRVAVPRLVVYHEPLDRIRARYVPAGGGFGGSAKAVARFAAMAVAALAANALWLPRHNRDIFSIPERVVVHTEYRAEMVRRFAPQARVSVLPHPVYEPREPGGAGSAFVPPFPAGSVVLTVFGFIDHRKDYGGVLDALRRLPARYRLVVAGGPHEEGERRSPFSPYGRMAAFVRRHGLADRVHVTGYCPDETVAAIMRATDVVIAPFTEDHSSGSINMGIAYGRPVIAYRTLLTEEMYRNGAGLVLVGGREELAGALAAFGEDRGPFAEAVLIGSAYRQACGFPAAAERLLRWYGEIRAYR